MQTILDTHFVLWIIGGSIRLNAFPWLDRYRPWGISPVSLLEIAYLSEAGRIDADEALTNKLSDDPRFVIDDLGSFALMRRAVTLRWTRDPFDRLLAAHSAMRRVPLCSVDMSILRHHDLVPRELAGQP